MRYETIEQSLQTMSHGPHPARLAFLSNPGIGREEKGRQTQVIPHPRCLCKDSGVGDCLDPPSRLPSKICKIYNVAFILKSLEIPGIGNKLF